jgi:hypothetical protein
MATLSDHTDHIVAICGTDDVIVQLASNAGRAIALFGAVFCLLQCQT